MEEFSENEFKQGVKVMLIKRYVFSNEAYLAAASLKAAGINCFVGNSTMGTMVPFSEGSFTLHIDETDQEAAITLLKDFENPTAEDEDFRDASQEDIEYEKQVRAQEELVEKASPKMAMKLLIALLIITIIFFILKNGIDL